MAFPEPEVGLVISYSYLWSDEASDGHVEGRKDRPCTIVMAVQQGDGEPPQVAVVPVTHSRHSDEETAIEIPPKVAKHLGLDADASWVVLDDVNVFSWPGYDLRQIPGQAGCYTYGLLPPRFFKIIVKRFLELRQAEAIAETSRNDAPD